tara:strand:- start:146 stop:1024 length:879 start_codon:yes stop_codon:yes gene_type:complete
MKKNKILITGASGFLGHSVSNLLSTNKKYEIIPIGRKIKHWNSKYIKKNLKFFDFKKNKISKFGNLDTIIHCAGLHGDDKNKWEEYYKNNVLITKNIIDSNNFKKLIFISTFSVLSDKKKFRDLVDPCNNYGLSKYIAEKLIEYKSKIKNNTKFIIIRFPTIIGQNSKNNLIDYIYNQSKKGKKIEIYGNSNLKRNFIHVSNASETIKNTLKINRLNLNFQIYNAASSNSMKIKDMIDIINNKNISKSKIKIINKKTTYDFDVKIDIKKSIQSKILIPNSTKSNILKYINEK